MAEEKKTVKELMEMDLETLLRENLGTRTDYFKVMLMFKAVQNLERIALSLERIVLNLK